MKVSQITEPNVLSLWLGEISDFGDLDEYIWGKFEQDYGIEFGDRTAPESDAHESPKPVRELIDGFSFSDQWIDDAVAVCERSGWSDANCAVVLYNIRYQEGLANPSSDNAALKFVGNVEWNGASP